MRCSTIRKAGEVARAWISGGGLSLSLHAMAFGKPEVWGHVLAGMAQQVAAACGRNGHMATRADNFAAIRKVLNEDLSKVAAKLSPLAAKS